MQLKSFAFKKYHTEQHGILEGHFSRFSDTICLVGKNGSGKTRILKILEAELTRNYLYHYFSSNIITKVKDSPMRQAWRARIGGIEDLAPLFYSGGAGVQKGYERFGQKLSTLGGSNSQADSFEKLDADLKAEISGGVVEISYHKFKNLSVNRSDAKDFTQWSLTIPNTLKAVRDKLRPQVAKLDIHFNTSNLSHAVDTIVKKGIHYMEDLAKVLALEEIQNYRNRAAIEASDNYKRFENINSLINALLAKNLQYKVDVDSVVVGETIGGINGRWFINEREFKYSDLSDGEKVLFSFALLLFAHQQNSNVPIEDSIIIIDEPETHLHPQLQILLVKRLQTIIKGQGQLIIATHSLHIISSLAPEEIYLVEDGQLFPPSSKNVSKIVESLIGLGEDFEKFKEFCFEEFDFGFRSFIGQCFLKPDIILSAQEHDPQIELFKRSIQTEKRINLLDFGAGAGRLGKEILPEIQSGKINYFTYDNITDYNEELIKLGSKKCFTDLASIPSGTFDYVILCNVLHEINLDAIVPELQVLLEAVKPSGYLIIIEDKLLNKGEKAHDDGFLLFTESELPKLLEVSTQIGLLKVEEPRYLERIMCAVIPRKDIGEIKDTSLISALESLRQNSYQKFKDIRLSKDEHFKSTYEKGRISAFYSQQYMNASFALEKLRGSAESSRVEIEASFPGDWPGFLKKNLNAEVPAINNAPKGEYSVVVRFMIDSKGVISDLTPETSHGYGMEEEVIRMLKLAPGWNPASVDGKFVNAYRRQPITFVVE